LLSPSRLARNKSDVYFVIYSSRGRTVMTATLPAGGTPLVGYWGSDSSQHVDFLGQDQHVHELYIAPNSGGWVDHDLTALSGAITAPTLGSPLDGYWGTDNSQHVNFIGEDGHVHELYLPAGATHWVDNDLTALAGAVAPSDSTSLDGYWGTDNSQHVNFISANNHVHELYIAPDSSGWVDNDLTALAHTVTPIVGTSLYSYWGSDNSQHVHYISADNHIHQLCISPVSGGWVDLDLTQSAGAVAAVVERGLGGLAGYWGGDNSEHVHYIGIDTHLHELYRAPGANQWVDNDLTKLAAAVAPVQKTTLDSYWGSDNSQHVNFLGQDGHLHELYLAPGSSNWVDNDLSAMAGGALPQYLTELDGYWGGDNSQHVNFIAGDAIQHVHELYIAPGTGWVNNDLTALA
jgi:hypothetical protein